MFPVRIKPERIKSLTYGGYRSGGDDELGFSLGGAFKSFGNSVKNTFVPSSNPTNSTFSTSGTVSNQPSKLDKILTVVSQGIAGFAPNQTVQTSGGLIPVYGQPQQVETPVQQIQQTQVNDASKGVGQGIGQGLGSGLDGIINWASANPLIVGGGALGLYLLFKQPPTGKR